jgi:hypothetical protein
LKHVLVIFANFRLLDDKRRDVRRRFSSMSHVTLRPILATIANFWTSEW